MTNKLRTKDFPNVDAEYAYDEGREAWHTGASIKESPYWEGSAESSSYLHIFWTRGWKNEEDKCLRLGELSEGGLQKALYTIRILNEQQLMVWTDLKAYWLQEIDGVQSVTTVGPTTTGPFRVQIDPRWPIKYYRKHIRDAHRIAIANVDERTISDTWRTRPHPSSCFPEEEKET